MKKVLIIGHKGFIGKPLVQELQKLNLTIFTLSRSNKLSKTNFKGSFFDKKLVTNILKKIKPDIVIHLAWETTPSLFYISKQNKKWSKRTIEFIKEFYFLGGSKFIFMSTCEEYGIYENKIKTNEHSPCNPISNYGIEKNKVSSFLQENYNQKKWIILRNYFVVGLNERKEKLLSYMINNIKRNKPVILKRPYDIIDIIDVRDVVNIIKNLLKMNFSGILNIGNSIENSPLDLAKILVSLFGSGKIICDEKVNNMQKKNYIVSDNTKLKGTLKLTTKFSTLEIIRYMLVNKNV